VSRWESRRLHRAELYLTIVPELLSTNDDNQRLLGINPLLRHAALAGPDYYSRALAIQGLLKQVGEIDSGMRSREAEAVKNERAPIAAEVNAKLNELSETLRKKLRSRLF